MADENILIVDDDNHMLDVLELSIAAEGYKIVTSTNVNDAISAAKNNMFDLALVDLRIAEESGIELMNNISRISPEVPVIILTAHGTIKTAVEAMKQGAYGYLVKPFDHRELILQIKNGLEKSSLSREVRRLKTLIGERYGFKNIIGKSKKMQEVMEQVSRAAETDSNVCICGESGTGKELIAKSLHLLSSRKNNSFVAINCAAIPEGLIEGELFGYERGAFTGAIKNKKGFFAQANGGSIFMDEISEMSELMQAKLLRVLQEKHFYPLGAEKLIKSDARILTATNKDLKDEVKKGSFREDLFYRIYVIPIHLPPLRERKKDIPLLADHFIKNFSKKMNKSIKGISTDSLQKLLSYSWPGNVRELENTIEYAVAMTTKDVISDELMLHIDKTIEDDRIKPMKKAKNDFEKKYLIKLMEYTHGNITKASTIAKKYRADLYKILEKYEIKPTDFRKNICSK
ncbi:MAG: sigma-54 dependent transcriptional regulator [Deltaproteobacteria bacterium]|nr:sigma-54 dependent transcriptional regulator [Deltaproteobacteria bacterium]